MQIIEYVDQPFKRFDADDVAPFNKRVEDCFINSPTVAFTEKIILTHQDCPAVDIIHD